MAHDITMPQLGMAQDTGRLVTWLKAPGDAVAKGDALFEVETDKTTMEVEAPTAGFLTGVTAQEGEDVPVGQTIAKITDTKDEAPTPQATAQKPDAEPAPEPEPTPEPDPAPKTKAPPPAVQPSPGGRILASPKTRRLAQERGLDLNRLAEAGYPQPFHVADLDVLAAMGAAAPTLGGGRSLITAACDSGAFEALLERLDQDAGITLEPHVLVAGFAAAALRGTLDDPAQRIVVGLSQGADGEVFLYADPDLTRPTRPRMAGAEAEPDIMLRDLTDTRIHSAAFMTDTAPAITLGGSHGRPFSAALSFGSDLETGAAIRLLDGFAARLEAPLEHLV